MSPRVLLVLPTRSYRAAAFLEAARRAGIELVLASDEPTTLGGLGREVVVDLGGPEEAAGRAAAALAAAPVDGVVGVDEAAVLTAAHIAARLGLRHHPVEAVARTRDKRRLRRALADAGIPQPVWAEVGSGAGAGGVGAAAERVGGFPVVAKPVGLAASRGVLRADDRAGLERAVTRIGALLDRLGCVPEEGGHPILVERFIDGAEVAVEGLVDRGRVHVLAVFDKPDPLDGPTFAETIYTTPSRHPVATRAQLTALTVAAARALGLSDGPLHAELRIPMSGPVVIEAAARSIGGLCSRTLRLGPGGSWSLEELILRHAVGQPVGEAELTRTGAGSGVLMLPVGRAGTVRAIAGVAAATAVPGVDGVSITVPVGTAVEPLPEGDRYLGFVFASAPTALEVEVALRDAWSRISVDIG